MNIKKSLIVIFLVVGSHRLSAQSMGSEYKTALGFKFYPGAVSVKTFTENNKALEGLAYFWDYGFRFTGLYEIHGDINGVEGLKWYVGPGAHLGFWNNKWKTNYADRQNTVAIGVDGVLGLDYKISGAPIDLSLDWQPSLNIVGYTYFEGGWGGFAVRYAF